MDDTYCYRCGDKVIPNVDAILDYGDNYLCAICHYIEFDVFPTGMTPTDYPENYHSSSSSSSPPIAGT